MKKKKRYGVIILVVIAILLAISYSKFLGEENSDLNQGQSEGPTISDVLDSKDVDTYCDPFWNTVFDFPTDEEITQYNKSNQKRSPYIAGWFQMPADTKYTEYMIDFRADCIANGTYLSLGNWFMDYSYLESQYESVRVDSSVHAYAGFQKINNGQMYSIMSFWDVFCKDYTGKETVIRAKRVFPETTGSKEEFDGEGTGAHHSDLYAWESDHWYRMVLKCSTSNETGNTLVEQGVWDLETDTYTTLCIYDIGVPNATFKGPIAIFLENYDAQYAGHVRTMEVCNAKYLNSDTNQWKDLKQIYISSQQPGGDQPLSYNGSYNFGVTENRFWMITSGLGGDWHNNGTGKQGDYFSVE